VSDGLVSINARAGEALLPRDSTKTEASAIVWKRPCRVSPKRG